MTEKDDRELLVEEASGAARPVRDGQVGMLPAWHDLDEAGRKEAFDRAEKLRKMEAALDEAGRSTTVKAVLAKIKEAGRRS